MSIVERQHRTARPASFSRQPFAPATDTIGKWLRTVLILVLAVAATAVPVFFHMGGQLIGIAFSVGFALMIAAYFPEAALVTLIVAYLFQNFFVAVVSPYVGSPQELTPLRGYNFILTFVIWVGISLRYWTARTSYHRGVRSMMTATTLLLFVVGFYFVIGFVSGLSSATHLPAQHRNAVPAVSDLLDHHLLLAHNNDRCVDRDRVSRIAVWISGDLRIRPVLHRVPWRHLPGAADQGGFRFAEPG